MLGPAVGTEGCALAQGQAGASLEHGQQHPVRLPGGTLQFLAVLAPVGLTPSQGAVLPGRAALHHGLRPPPLPHVQLVPQQGQIPPPAPCALCARHGLGQEGEGGIWGRRAACPGQGRCCGVLSRAPQALWDPGSALPPVPVRLHLREADAPGGVCIQRVYVRALRGRFESQPHATGTARPLSPAPGDTQVPASQRRAVPLARHGHIWPQRGHNPFAPSHTRGSLRCGRSRDATSGPGAERGRFCTHPGDTEARASPAGAVVANCCALMAVKQLLALTPPGSAPGRALIILFASSGPWHSGAAWGCRVAPV